MATIFRRIYEEAKVSHSSSRAQSSAAHMARWLWILPISASCDSYARMIQAAATALTISLFLAYFAHFLSTLTTCLAMHIEMSLLDHSRSSR
ncbi:hypothetical protein BS47DRAFT_1403117 [Hydnum rufescens UP504]|uniref:Uncharacterized protein n=1 Tax=Hydnum rufescens UP504 TaxID=1448309 RepID=A0A9P6ABS6_9AGAM|nr:hypothetical protein BS47DRAFT_1403117 [Hydnum rufescens UP504]